MKDITHLLHQLRAESQDEKVMIEDLQWIENTVEFELNAILWTQKETFQKVHFAHFQFLHGFLNYLISAFWYVFIKQATPEENYTLQHVYAA